MPDHHRHHVGPPVCLLLLLLLTGSRPEVTSVSRRTWTGIEPLDAPIYDLPSPSLLTCTHQCAAGSGGGSICAALHYEAGRCRLYQHAACKYGGRGLRNASSATGRYVEMGDSPTLCPSDDPCSRFCQSAAWLLLGRPMPGTVDVWSGGDKWTEVVKRLTAGQCEVQLAAATISAADKLTVTVASVSDEGRTVKFVAGFTSYVLYHYGEDVGWGNLNSGALHQGRQMTPIAISWCAGLLRLSSAGVPFVSISRSVPDDLQVIKLGSSGLARWRLGPHVADPWAAEEDGWSSQRSYTVTPYNAIWRRVPASANASITFRCATQRSCRIFARASLSSSLQVNVRLSVDDMSKIGLGNETHVTWQSTWPMDWMDASVPRWFRVEFSNGSVSVFTENAAQNAVLLIQDVTLQASQWFSQVPQMMQYVGLGGESAPAVFRVFEYDRDWGHEQGFTVGAGLITEEEAEAHAEASEAV